MPITTIDAGTLKIWLDQGDAVLVDVRDPSEYAARHVPGAVSIPLSIFGAATVPVEQDKKLVIQCQRGMRSGRACAQLQREMPEAELYNLGGGISAWVKSGYQTVGSGRSIPPLNRQVQMTIGILVLTASLLAYFVNPLFFLMSAFIGFGLIFSGLTGFCGLARLLEKMPWNTGN